MQESTSVFGAIDWMVIIGYFVAIMAIGFYVSRRQQDSSTFFLGGRSMPIWAVTLSVLATTLSAATFFGAPQMSFNGNLTYLIMNIGEVISAFLVAYLFIPPIFHAGTITIYGFLGKRFGKPSMMAVSAMFLFGRLLASGARHFMAGIGFSLMLYGSTQKNEMAMAVILLGFVGTLYTMSGGVRAVIWTETVQITIVVMSAFLSIYLLLKAIPVPVDQLWTALRDSNGVNKLMIVDTRFDFGLDFTIWTGIIASTFMSSATYGADHDLAQRMLTTRSAFHGGVALISSKLLGIPIVMLFLTIGLLLHVYYGRPDLMGAAAPLDVVQSTKNVYPQFLLNHLPIGVRGLAMAGLCAAAMGSFNSAINAMASTAIADLYIPWKAWRAGKEDEEWAHKHNLHAPRIAVALMGFLLTAFALVATYAYDENTETLINFALSIMAYSLAPLLGVFCTALFTKRGNTYSVLTALFLGALAVWLLQPGQIPEWCHFKLAWPWIYVAVSPFCFVLCILGGKSKAAS